MRTDEDIQEIFGAILKVGEEPRDSLYEGLSKNTNMTERKLRARFEEESGDYDGGPMPVVVG